MLSCLPHLRNGCGRVDTTLNMWATWGYAMLLTRQFVNTRNHTTPSW